MTRLRLLVAVVLVLAASSCQFVDQENFISFTWDGVQYYFTASDDDSGHPYAVGIAPVGQDPYEYQIWGSATAEDAQAGTNTILIDIGADGDWYATATFWDSYGDSTWLYLSQIPEGMIDTFIANRDAIGEQFAGSMPGPFQGESPELKNIVFSVERLPNQQMIEAQ